MILSACEAKPSSQKGARMNATDAFSSALVLALRIRFLPLPVVKRIPKSEDICIRTVFVLVFLIRCKDRLGHVCF